MFTIKGELTDLNTYVDACRANHFAGNKIKQEQTDYVYYEAKKQKLKSLKAYPLTIHFKWYSKDSRKDIDNVSFSKKFILDGLVKADVLQGDSRKYISGLIDSFFIDKENPRVEVLFLT